MRMTLGIIFKSSTGLKLEHIVVDKAFYQILKQFVSSGKKDDEMDPMDPSAYSDAPRYAITSLPGPVYS